MCRRTACRALSETLKMVPAKGNLTELEHALQCTVGLLFIRDNFVVMSHRLAPEVSPLPCPAIVPSRPSSYPPQHPYHPLSLLESQLHFKLWLEGKCFSVKVCWLWGFLFSFDLIFPNNSFRGNYPEWQRGYPHPRNKCFGDWGWGWGVIDGAFCISLLPDDLINSGKLPRHQSVYLFTTLKVIYLTFENWDHTSCWKQCTFRHTRWLWRCWSLQLEALYHFFLVLIWMGSICWILSTNIFEGHCLNIWR